MSIRASTASSGSATTSIKAGKPAKGKAKASIADKDILVDADVKLKAGVHYGLLGRNGSGKSSEWNCHKDGSKQNEREREREHGVAHRHMVALLKALATKVIPGMSLATRIAHLQQTAETCHGDAACIPAAESSAGQDDEERQSVLQYILSNDEARKHIQNELASTRLLWKLFSNLVANYFFAVLTSTSPQLGDEGEEDRDIAQIKAYRRLQISRKKHQLAQHQHNAALKSGVRGSQARKELVEFEKEVEDARFR